MAGRTYFIPENVNAYGDQSALGQAAIAHDNQVAYLKAKLDIANEGLRMANRAVADANSVSAQVGLFAQPDPSTPEGIYRMLDRQSPAERLVDSVFSRAPRVPGETYLTAAPPQVATETLSVGEQAIRNSLEHQVGANLAGSVVGISKGIGETGASLAWNVGQQRYAAAAVDLALLATTVAPGFGGAAVRAVQSERAALMSSLSAEMRAVLLADLPRVAAIDGISPTIARLDRLSFMPSSGVELVAVPGRTTTVLGNYGQDMKNIVNELGNVKTLDFGARPGGFNILNAPDPLYLNPKQFWADYNEPWLGKAVSRGDTFLMATEPQFGASSKLFRLNDATGKLELSGFGKEYLYLRQNELVYDPITKQMVPK